MGLVSWLGKAARGIWNGVKSMWGAASRSYRSGGIVKDVLDLVGVVPGWGIAADLTGLALGGLNPGNHLSNDQPRNSEQARMPGRRQTT